MVDRMCEAIATADLEDIHAYIASGQVDVNATFDTSGIYCDTNGCPSRPIRNCTYCHLAAMVDDVNIMRILIDAKADITRKTGTYFAGVNFGSPLLPGEPAKGPVVFDRHRSRQDG